MRMNLPIIALVLLAVHTNTSAARLPKIPDIIFGVNQYNVGQPADLAKNWPLTDSDANYLKGIGCNTIRFPLYPSEVGINESALVDWNTNDVFDPKTIGSPDWRSLDKVIDWCIEYRFTPFICPSTEKRDDWTSKAWMSLHVPENAIRVQWFTKLVVDHITEKYGDQVIYGWYEDWYWNSFKHERSAQFPKAFQAKLRSIYKGKISSLNKAWNTCYKSFEDVSIPKTYINGDIPENAINSRQSYDFKLAVDLMHRDVLGQIHEYIKRKAPNAIWAGGSLLDGLGALNDIRSVTVPRTNATMRTAAMTSDVVSADVYGPCFTYYSYYRTLSKIAAVEGKRLLVVETAATKPETFKWILDVGGPSAGTLAWVGKEDLFGFIAWDGTRRIENGNAYRAMFDTYTRNEADYASYKPGHIRVYFPEETLYYSISERNQVDAYQHICDNMMPGELEPVFTDELEKLPQDAKIYVLERTIPLKAIKIFRQMGDRVICPHEYFIDENGDRYQAASLHRDFYAKLLADPDGKKLLDVFQRVEEKEKNVSLKYYGTSIFTSAELAPKNKVLSDRENDLSNLIDGSIYDGVTFADKDQDNRIFIRLNRPKMVYGAFVQFYEGNGQDIGASPLPEQMIISVSMDGMDYNEVARLTSAEIKMRPHIRFNMARARYICFDLGTTHDGIMIEELGVIGDR